MCELVYRRKRREQSPRALINNLPDFTALLHSLRDLLFKTIPSMIPHIKATLRRAAGLFRRKQHEAEMSEELQAHVDGLIERNIAADMPFEEARPVRQPG